MKDICLIGTNGQQKPIISAACRRLNVSFPSNLTRKLHTHQILEESSPEQEMMIRTIDEAEVLTSESHQKVKYSRWLDLLIKIR